MKKIKLNTAKLQLNKEKIASLTNDEMAQVNGGFTYSLSTGARCQASKAAGGQNPFDCGVILASTQLCKEQTI